MTGDWSAIVAGTEVRGTKFWSTTFRSAGFWAASVGLTLALCKGPLDKGEMSSMSKDPTDIGKCWDSWEED